LYKSQNLTTDNTDDTDYTDQEMTRSDRKKIGANPFVAGIVMDCGIKKLR
jgi:hypothetical protein